MASLSEARSKIFLLLGFLMGGQHLKRVLGLIGFGIRVNNLDIQSKYSQYRTMGPETMDKDITMAITRRGWRGEEAEGAGAKGVMGVGA